MKKTKILKMVSLVIVAISLFSACGKKETTKDEKLKATEIAKETSTPKPTPTPTTKETSNEAIEISESAISENTITEEPTAEPEAQPTIETNNNVTEINNKIMYAIQDINIRSGAGTSNNVIGSLSKGQAVTVTGQDNFSKWYRINANGIEGYVSNKYLSDNAVSSNSTASTSKSGDNSPSKNGGNSNNGNTNNGNTNNNTNSNNSDNGNGGSINNTPPINEQNNPTVVVEEPPQQPQPEQIQLPDIEQAKNDIIATLRAKGCVTPEEYIISKAGQEFWNNYIAEWGQAAYTDGLGWFEGRVSYDDYWQNINGIAANYSNNGKYWIKYLRTEGKYLIFKCYVG